MFVDRGNLLGLEGINERIQYLFIESGLEQQIDTILKPMSDFESLHHNPRHNTPRNKLIDRFQDILDLLLSYSGYLDNRF